MDEPVAAPSRNRLAGHRHRHPLSLNRRPHFYIRTLNSDWSLKRSAGMSYRASEEHLSSPASLEYDKTCRRCASLTGGYLLGPALLAVEVDAIDLRTF